MESDEEVFAGLSALVEGGGEERSEEQRIRLLLLKALRWAERGCGRRTRPPGVEGN